MRVLFITKRPLGEERCSEMAEAAALLQSDHYDAVVVDLTDRCYSLAALRTHEPNMPVVAIVNDAKTATAALSRGAQDYLVDGYTDETLDQTVRTAIARKFGEERDWIRAVRERLENLERSVQECAATCNFSRPSAAVIP